MKKAMFTFQCRLTAPAFFSPYKGSMLRGTLGAFLKKTCCTMRLSSCEKCIIVRHCAFPLLFLGKSVAEKDSITQLPPPYCIEPGDTGKTFYAADDYFLFNLKLFSYAVDYLPYFVHAFILAGRHGMGKKKDGEQGTFELQQVLHRGRPIFDPEAQRVEIPAGEDLSLPCWDSSASGQGTLIVHLKTPCRFKASNHLSAELSFRQLFKLIIRRIRMVWALDEERILFNNFFEMMNRAGIIETVENQLYWKDWTRYSSRQKSSMQLGGLQGTVCYHGDLLAFLPFFILGEALNIGKQTSFGLGQIQVEWVPDEKNSDSVVR